MDATRWFILLLIVTAFPAFTQGEETLPRVLIFGDSIYQQPAGEAAKMLKGRAEVVYATMKPGEVRNTEVALANLNELLGDGDWDLIHFNFGLGDLVYRAPGMKAFRVMPKQAGGIRTTTPAQYENNLRELVKRLKAIDAKLIWASTTPIRHSATNIFDMESEIQYNAIAAKVMSAEGITISDMYEHVKSLIDMTKPAAHGADPFFFDRKPIHLPIVASIVRKLSLPTQLEAGDD